MTNDAPPAPRWEYKVWSEGVRARLNDRRLEAELNELGAEGWELVQSHGDERIFKRPLRDGS
ncbi:MAG: DUF4177 domain-containing protein [Solirubrobacteraceae bacterium]